MSRFKAIVAALALAATLTGCDRVTDSAAVSATQAATMHVTRAARATELVWTDISVTQEGTIAANNARLQIDITITNRTTMPIHIVRPCGYEPVIVQMIPVNGQGLLWTQDTYSCPLQPGKDDSEIAPGAAYTYQYKADLSGYAARVGHGGFHPGEYRVTARYAWHQGAADHLGTVTTLLYGKATGETITTLR